MSSAWNSIHCIRVFLRSWSQVGVEVFDGFNWVSTIFEHFVFSFINLERLSTFEVRVLAKGGHFRDAKKLIFILWF